MISALQRRPESTPAPVRIVHLGLGNFFRAHQAWYTAHASDSAQWGIAAFTGRRPDMAQALAPQQGLYTLITRTPDGDEFEVIDSVSAVHTADEHEAWCGYFADPKVVIASITVTEAAYLFDGSGLAADSSAEADIEALATSPQAPVSTVPGKLVAGLLTRKNAGAGPMAVMSCDNLPHNGDVTAAVVTDLAHRVDPQLAAWIKQNISFVSTMVDRITPAATPEDKQAIAEQLQLIDVSPVRTEPFSEWVIAGAFPGGHPDWESAGAQFVEDALPHEQRKLLLLNGAHSLLAYAASTIGHTTVDAAIADPRCRSWVDNLWQDATFAIELPREELNSYRQALVKRFENPRMSDALARIAMDGSQKIPVRIVPVVQAVRAAGEVPAGATVALAGWVAHLRGFGAPINDARGTSWPKTAAGDIHAAIPLVLERLGLGEDTALSSAVISAYENLTEGIALP